MKKLILAASLIGIAFASCKKGNDNSNAAIIGKWNWDTDVSSIKMTGSINGSPIDTIITDTATINDGSYLEFTSTGKAYSFSAQNTQPYDTGFYKVNGNSLYMTNVAGTDTSTIQIIKLTNHALVLYAVRNEDAIDLSAEQQDWLYLSK